LSECFTNIASVNYRKKSLASIDLMILQLHVNIEAAEISFGIKRIRYCLLS